MNSIDNPNNENIVEVHEVHKVFKTSTGVLQQILRGESPVNVAVDGVSLNIRKRETLALVGESGCGKTTLGKMVCMLEEPTEGTIYLNGEDITKANDRRIQNLRSKVQMIFQDPYDSLDPRQTVSALVEEPLILQKVGDSKTRQEKVFETINAVELHPPETFLNRYPHELSGGQRQRVAIARVMVLQPKVIVADEPVSMLDVSIRSGILNMMMDIKERLGISFLFITHDLSIGSYVSDRIAVMYLGDIVETGLTDVVVDQPIHPYTRLLLAAVPRIPWGKNQETQSKRRRVQLIGDVFEKQSRKLIGCKFAPRCPLAQDVCYKEHPQLKQYDGRLVACFFSDKSKCLSKEELLSKASQMFQEQLET